MSINYPNETADYREKRNALLAEEIALRAQIEKVAKRRRSLPQGGMVAQDYAFTSVPGHKRRMSDLFHQNKNVLAVYSLMFKPEDTAPCPMCVSLLDGLNGQMRYVRDVINMAVVSSATPTQLGDLASAREWGNLNLLSAHGTQYQSDYYGEAANGAQLPMMNIFHRTSEGMFHFWGSEGFFADVPGQPRHVDQIWPLWNILDMTPQGRGSDWYPSLAH